MDSPNHLNYISKAQGTLAVLEILPSSKSKSSNFHFSFILCIDTSIKIALLHNSACFFFQKRSIEDETEIESTIPSIQQYFGSVKTIRFEDIFNKKFRLHYLNQLTQHRPFQNLADPTVIPSYLISQHDHCFNSSPHGPCSFDYKHIHSCKLYETALKDSPNSLFNFNFKTHNKKPNSSTTKDKKARPK